MISEFRKSWGSSASEGSPFESNQTAVPSATAANHTKKVQKRIGTAHSEGVSHLRTTAARTGLTSEFGWDQVLFGRYGRSVSFTNCAGIYSTDLDTAHFSPPMPSLISVLALVATLRANLNSLDALLEEHGVGEVSGDGLTPGACARSQRVRVSIPFPSLTSTPHPPLARSVQRGLAVGWAATHPQRTAL